MYQTVRMPCSGGWYCRVVRIDKREGERENNTFWYIKEMIERELNKAYRINPQHATVSTSNLQSNQADFQHKEVDNPAV